MNHLLSSLVILEYGEGVKPLSAETMQDLYDRAESIVHRLLI